LPRAAQVEQNLDTPILAENLTADGPVEDATVAAPPEFDPAQLKDMIARQVAESMVPAMQAILPELMKTLVPQGTTGQGPTSVTHVPLVSDAPVKPAYLKHYRMDGVVSGKYQLIDVTKLNDEGNIEYVTSMGPDGRWRGEAIGVIKGRWIHFQNEHFYATDPLEVAFVDWKIANDPGFRAYEDKNLGGNITCYVANCGRSFPDEDTLAAHRRATHGVD
jgi:hypothetical protein